MLLPVAVTVYVRTASASGTVVVAAAGLCVCVCVLASLLLSAPFPAYRFGIKTHIKMRRKSGAPKDRPGDIQGILPFANRKVCSRAEPFQA